MSTTKRRPSTLLEAIRYFSDLDLCTAFVAKLRWPTDPACPKCGIIDKHSYLTTRRIWKCKACKKQFSVKVGTIFEDSPLGLDKWLPAIWLTTNSKNGISSHELARSLGVTQKSAWFMLHRIRLAMQTGSFDKLDGTVEVDETFIGGKARNMHKDVASARSPAPGAQTKRSSSAFASATAKCEPRSRTTGAATPCTDIGEHVEPGAAVYTDQLNSYSGLSPEFAHETVDHAERYVDGQVHTNGVENFWSLLKRGLHGTYVSVKPFHLFRYLDERVFTYNMRDDSDYGRFEAVLRAAAGQRLTYAEVTGQR